ncbi:MAG: zf-HC2 domain-containing protein [Candidatus Obscuribacterales bacterium]|nr:zf-HC2 domain-containing protein [Candidatus Obscuribacterales bacterium]
MSSMNSQCETFVPMLDAFVDNELDGSEKEQLAKHLSFCEDCKRVVKEIEALKATLSSLPRRQMKFDLADNFDAVIAKQSSCGAESSGTVVPLRRKHKWLIASASAAAVVVIAIAGSIVSKGDVQQVAQSNPADQTRAVALRDQSKTVESAIANGAGAVGAVDDVAVEDSAMRSQAALPADRLPPDKIAAAPQSRQSPDVLRKTAGAHLSDETERLAQNAQVAPVQENSAAAPVAAHLNSSKTVVPAAQNIGNRAGASELLALYEDDDGISSDIGVSTDEDGLYAIKL